MPDVSFVIAARDAGRFIEAAVASALGQEGVAVEVIVVDDGSRDDTRSRLAALADGRLRLITMPESVGPFAAALAGLAQVRAPVVLRLDADDVAAPTRAVLQLEALRSQPRAAIVGGAARVIDESGGVLGRWDTPRSTAAIIWRACTTMPFAHSTFAWRTAALKECGVHYLADRRVGDDYGLLARAFAVTEVVAVADTLVDYRRVPSGISASQPAAQRRAQQAAAFAIARLIDPALDAKTHGALREAVGDGRVTRDLREVVLRLFDALVAMCRTRGLAAGLDEAATWRDVDLARVAAATERSRQARGL